MTRVLMAVTALALLAASAAGGERLTIHVSHVARFAPADIRMQVVVEPAADNRILEIVAESEEMYTRSTVDLQGERAPRVRSVCFPQLPAGVYQLSVIIRDTDGNVIAHETDSLTII